MRKILLALCLSVAALSTGCAVGPLVSHETARTNGKNKHEIIGGYGQAGLVVKWNYGFTERFDFGFHLESLSVGVRAKYGFIRNEIGWSLAGALGLGSSVGGNHYYGDLMASYMTGSWEPYGTFRLVHVKNDPWEFRGEDTGEVDFKVDSITYEYGQFMLGTRYWFNPIWHLSLEASTLFPVSSELDIGSNVLIGLALGARF